MDSVEPELRTWEAWQTIHQPFELEWWKDHLLKDDNSLADPGFTERWDEVREFVQPHGKIIDIGCGPRPPFAPCTVIEPLAHKYQQIVPEAWWEGVEVHAQPAEALVLGLRGDTIICWNCIDHLIGWRTVLDNMRDYAIPHARIAICTDFWPPFIGHPGFPRADFMAEIEERFNIHKQREPFGRHMALLMTART